MTFRVERFEKDGFEQAKVYDITNGNEVFVGEVKPFIWNEGIKDAEVVSLEPFDNQGQRINTGHKDIENQINFIKLYYTHHKLKVKEINEKWESDKEFALSIGVDERTFKRYSNVRNYVDSIKKSVMELTDLSAQLKDLVSFRLSSFEECPKAVKNLVNDEISSIKTSMDKLDNVIVKYKKYIEEYKK